MARRNKKKIARATTHSPAISKRTKRRGTKKAAADLDISTGGGEVVAGFIFMCDEKTKPDCFRFSVFGLPKKKAALVDRIRPGATLFLLDVEMKLLYGLYRATSNGGMSLEPQAFGGRFPAQVRFKIEKDCLPLRENIFKDAIKENYKSERKFTPRLNFDQVNRLLSLFYSATLPQQIPPQQIKDQLIPSYKSPHLKDPCRPGHMTYVPPSANLCYNPQHVPPARPAPSVVDPYRATPTAPSTDPYYRRNHMSTCCPGNSVPYKCGCFRAVPETIPRAPLPVPAPFRHSLPRYQDPNQANSHNLHRPAISMAGMPNMPGPLRCSCAASARSYC